MSATEFENGGSHSLHRREFVKGAVYTAAAAAMIRPVLAQTNAPPPPPVPKPAAGMIPMRALGKTGVLVSALGLGGFHLGTAKDQQEATEIIDRALDAGVNFIDNA